MTGHQDTLAAKTVQLTSGQAIPSPPDVRYCCMRIEQSGADVLIWIKAVPGSSRNQIAGELGERLKVRISAPPEGGKANKAICELIASEIRIKSREVSIESGHASAEKTVRIRNANSKTVARALQK
jgi:uncharacterized protein